MTFNRMIFHRRVMIKIMPLSRIKVSSDIQRNELMNSPFQNDTTQNATQQNETEHIE